MQKVTQKGCGYVSQFILGYDQNTTPGWCQIKTFKDNPGGANLFRGNRPHRPSAVPTGHKVNPPSFQSRTVSRRCRAAARILTRIRKSVPVTFSDKQTFHDNDGFLDKTMKQ
jgi:hypothetical protein